MDPHEQIRLTQKKYGSMAMFVAIVIGLIFILFSQQPIGKGFILGSLFSVINFTAMGITLPYRIGISRQKATVVSGISLLARYILLAIPLVIAIRMDQINLPATICGLFTIQFLILCEHVFKLYFPATPKRADF